MKYWQKAIKIQLFSLIIGLIVSQSLFVSRCYAQNFKFEGGRKKNIIYFDFIKNLIIIPLSINGKGPFNFILDTGVNPMVITDPALKDSLFIKDVRSVKIDGFGEGNEIDAFLTNNLNVKVGNASTNSMPTVIFKEDFFNLSRYVGKKIYGLIGYNFFNSFLVSINYSSKKLSFSTNNGQAKLKGEKISLEFFDNKPYINVKVDAPQIGEATIKVIVDCGASHALSLETLNGNPFPLSEPNIVGNLGVGLSGEINGSIGRVSTFTVGSFVFKNVLTNFPRFNEVSAKIKLKERNGNLGSDILRRFNIIFDYQNNAMYLEKGSFFKSPFEHDMSGMEVYMAGKAPMSYFISRIEPGSPAERSDFHVNDEIIAINFKKIEEYKLDEISNMFKSGNGNTVIIEVWRGDRTLIKLMRLVKRI